MKEIEIRVGRNAAREIAGWLGRPEKWDKEPRRIIYVESLAMVSKIVSPERLRLLEALSSKGNNSINEIARKLKRPRESVSRDLHLLEQKGFVGFEKKGKQAKPKILVEKICIPIIAGESKHRRDQKQHF